MDLNDKTMASFQTNISPWGYNKVWQKNENNFLEMRLTSLQFLYIRTFVCSYCFIEMLFHCSYFYAVPNLVAMIYLNLAKFRDRWWHRRKRRY